MKNKKMIILISVCVIVLVLIILGLTQITSKIVNSYTKKDKTSEKYTNYEKDFGSYQVPSNWIEAVDSNSKYTYVEKSEKYNPNTNNISISMQTSKFSKDEHIEFKNNILKSLSEKSLGQIEVQAYGSSTKNGDILYTFTLSGDKGITTEYCIIGDYKFILITEVITKENLEKKDETSNISKQIINSFKWKD